MSEENLPSSLTPDSQDKIQNSNTARRKYWLIFLTAIFSVIGILCLVYWLVIGQFYETTNDAYVSGNLIKIMPRISGYVTKIMADETDRVEKGQPIIKLDQTDVLLTFEKAEATLGLTVRRVKQQYEDVGRLKDNVAQQETSLIKAQEDYERRQGLKINEEISIEEVRHAKLAVDTQTAALALSKQELAAAMALVSNSDLYNHPQVKEAAQRLREAYLALQRTTLYAPNTGYVAKRTVQVGQQVTPDSILMVIFPLDQVWVNANFKEPQLRNIRIGQNVECISDTYGRKIKYQGQVVGLSPGTGSVFDLLPPQNATGNWIKIVQRLPVRISVDPKQLDKYPLRDGFSMTVKVDTHDRNGKMLGRPLQNKTIYQTEEDHTNIERADQLIQKILRDNASNVNYPNVQ